MSSRIKDKAKAAVLLATDYLVLDNDAGTKAVTVAIAAAAILGQIAVQPHVSSIGGADYFVVQTSTGAKSVSATDIARNLLGIGGPSLASQRITTPTATLDASAVNRTVIADLFASPGVIAATLPDGTNLADGSQIRFLKDYEIAEGRFEIYPATTTPAQTVANQPMLPLTRDGDSCILEWNAATSDWKVVGQSYTAALRGGWFLQEHDYTTTSTLASPSVWSWMENGARVSQSDTTTGDQVFRIEDLTKGAQKTTRNASFSPMFAAAQKVSDDKNKVAYYAAIGNSFSHGASTHPGFVLEKCYQQVIFHTLGVEDEVIQSFDPHAGICEVRLSITQNDPWPTGAVAATNILWLTADKGDRIAIPNTTADGTHRIAHIRHVVDPTYGSSIIRDISDATYGNVAQANSKHNVFAHIWTDGRIVLILGTAGASDASELERGPDGFLVNKVGLAGGAGVQAGSARYLGHIYTDAAAKIVWPGVGNLALPSAPVKVGVRNLYNRRRLVITWSDASVASYTYASGTWQRMNANANAYIQFAQGKDDSEVKARTQSLASGAGGSIAAVAVGMDSVAPATGGSMGLTSSGRATISGEFVGYPASGTRTIGPWESSIVGGTATFEPLSTAGISAFRFEAEF